MFQRHSALGSEVLQYGLAYFSNFVNTKSARQCIAIFLKACRLVRFYLFSFSCSPAVVYLSEAVRLQVIVHIMESEAVKNTQHRAGFFAPCYKTAPTAQVLLSGLDWEPQSEICSESWGARLATAPGRQKLGKSVGNQSPIPPDPQVIPSLIKGCSTVIIKWWFLILPEQYSDYQMVIFNTAWAQWDKLWRQNFTFVQINARTATGPCQVSALDIISANLAEFPCRVLLQQAQGWGSSGAVGLQDQHVCLSYILSYILYLKRNKIDSVLALTIPIPLMLFLGLYLLFILKIFYV